MFGLRHLLAFATCCVAVLTGCGPKSPTRAQDQIASTHEAEPRRVVSVSVFADEVLWQLGASTRAKVVAVSATVDDPRYSPIPKTWPEDVPRIAGVAEQIVALDADLVILTGFTSAETIAAVEKAGIETLVLEHLDGFADYRTNVEHLARAVGEPDAAKPLLERFDSRRREIERAVHGIQTSGDAPVRPTIVVWNDGWVPGAKTTFDDAARLAGLKNRAAVAGRTGFTQVSAEQLVTWAPEWIVVPCPPPSDAATCEAAQARAANDPVLARTQAARRGQLITVANVTLYDVGEGMLDLAEALRVNVWGD